MPPHFKCSLPMICTVMVVKDVHGRPTHHRTNQQCYQFAASQPSTFFSIQCVSAVSDNGASSRDMLSSVKLCEWRLLAKTNVLKRVVIHLDVATTHRSFTLKVQGMIVFVIKSCYIYSNIFTTQMCFNEPQVLIKPFYNRWLI